MRITFFAPTIVGYLGWPDALYLRGLAGGLADARHDVRVVEERRNPHLTTTLRQLGSAPERAFYDIFPHLQRNTFDPRRGAQLLEWFTREIALLDVAVVVDGIDEQLVQWLAEIHLDGLTRLFIRFGSTGARHAAEVLSGFDAVLSPEQPLELDNWRRLPLTLAELDTPLVVGACRPTVDQRVAVEMFETTVSNVRGVR